MNVLPVYSHQKEPPSPNAKRRTIHAGSGTAKARFRVVLTTP